MLTLIPAYGRDYKTAKAARADWEAGKDFVIANIFHESDGKPTSRADWKPTDKFLIRYDRLAKIVAVTAKEPVAKADRKPRVAVQPKEAVPSWCKRCNGYGSSLSESSPICTVCGGSGLAVRS